MGSRYIKQIQAAIENGKVVLLEDMPESVDAVLDPILSRNFFYKGKTKYVKLGDKEVQYDDSFK